jgi:hypothetical protein
MKLATLLLILAALVIGLVVGTTIQPLRAQEQSAYKIVSVPGRIATEPRQWQYREDILNDWAKQGYELVWTQIVPGSGSPYPDVFILRKR